MSEVKRGPSGRTLGIDGPERTWGQVLYEHWCDAGPRSEDFRRYWPRMPAGERDWWERLAQGARQASVTDEMVERAWGAYSDPGDNATDQEEMDAMRHALEAALGGTA